nr:MAG TPA: hypothetical protein [Caudoviricetes sp.]
MTTEILKMKILSSHYGLSSSLYSPEGEIDL